MLSLQRLRTADSLATASFHIILDSINKVFKVLIYHILRDYATHTILLDYSLIT